MFIKSLITELVVVVFIKSIFIHLPNGIALVSLSLKPDRKSREGLKTLEGSFSDGWLEVNLPCLTN